MYAALVFRKPVIGGLVQKLRRVREDNKSVRKTFRYPQHALVLGRQLQCDVLPEGRRAFSEGDRHLAHRSLHHTHQFALRMPDLIMQAAQHVFSRFRVVVLDKIHIAPGQFGKPAPVEAFKKEAAIVAKYFWFDDQQIGDGGWDGNHWSLFACWVA